MWVLNRFFRWRYFRRERAKSYKLMTHTNPRLGKSFGRHLANSSREGARFSPLSILRKRKKRRILQLLVVLILLAFLFWIVVESIYGLSLF